MNSPESLVKAVQKVFSEIDRKIFELTQSTGISCLNGCGECCKRFEPFISTLEAMPLARYLIDNPPREQAFWQLVKNNNQTWNACALYEENSPFHCTVYAVRPSICRLFGYSARHQEGQNYFSSCSLIEKDQPQKVTHAKELVHQGHPVPIYQEVAQQLQEIDFLLATDYHPFSKSVTIAITLLKEEVSLEEYHRQCEEKQHSEQQQGRYTISYFLRHKILQEREL